jgi:hypothetical protein
MVENWTHVHGSIVEYLISVSAERAACHFSTMILDLK